MRKKRIYLDTSVISYLRQEDVPVQMAETHELWKILEKGKYEVYISETVTAELMRCAEPKRSELFALLSDIQYTEIAIEGNADILAIAEEIDKLGILPPKAINDRRHIAAPIFSGCNIIVSWNFEHMVNVKTIDGVRMVCYANNTAPVDIYSPSVLLERSVYDE
jgi:predicted nucleic acid-binding protein